MLAYRRSHAGGAHAVVIANFGADPLPGGYVFTGFPADGTWFDVMNEADESVQDDNAVIGLGGFEAKLLILYRCRAHVRERLSGVPSSVYDTNTG